MDIEQIKKAIYEEMVREFAKEYKKMNFVSKAAFRNAIKTTSEFKVLFNRGFVDVYQDGKIIARRKKKYPEILENQEIVISGIKLWQDISKNL